MEMLVWLVDKGPSIDQYKAGDVIVVCPDGWPWSDLEKTNADWVIVRTAILPVEAEALTAEPWVGEDGIGVMDEPRRQRLYKVDVTGLVGATVVDMEVQGFRSRVVDA